MGMELTNGCYGKKSVAETNIANVEHKVSQHINIRTTGIDYLQSPEEDNVKK
jgi:hypothetical protein